MMGLYAQQVSLPLCLLVYSAIWEISPKLRRAIAFGGVALASGLWVCCLASFVAERVFRVG